MKSPGELMEKRRKTHQHGLQHGEIRCEHIYIYIYTYSYIYVYISRVLYCFVLMLIQCWLFPYVFSFFVQKRFLLLTNSYSHKIYTHQVRITFKNTFRFESRLL